MRRETETLKGKHYKGEPRSVSAASRGVGGGHSTVDSKDSITLLEGRAPALTGTYSDEDGPVTAKGQSAKAQRTHRKVQVLQTKLHEAAKRNPNRTFGILYDKVCLWEVLWTSWIRVQRNKGAPGVDGRTIVAIKEEGEVEFIREIQRELMAKKYRPQPIRRVYIEKSNGKLRPLGIPIVKDRVVQGAVKLILEPIFESNFMPESYGFRPKRSCKDALRSVRKWVNYGYTTIIDADISSYFDNIDHDLLMNLVQRRVRDKWILRLIRCWLKCSIFEQDKALLSEKGTPQGGVISPLLANIYLHPLDKYWVGNHNGWKTQLVRYCDDFVVLIRDRSPAPYMKSVQGFLKRLKLNLSPEKTRIVEASDGFDFLGVRLISKPTRRDRTRKFCYGFPSPKAMKAIRGKIRKEVGKDHEKSIGEVIKYLNPIIRGWANYYSWLNSGERFHEIGRYTIQRLNRWNRAKQQRRRRAYRKLIGNELHQMGLFKITGRVVHVD